MILVPIKYKIDDYYNGSREVNGFAVKSDLPVRFCVREHFGEWVCDHYDSGAGFGPSFKTMEDAAMFAEVKMKWAIDERKLETALQKFYDSVASRKEKLT